MTKGWNKSGKKARYKNRWGNNNNRRKILDNAIEKSLTEEDYKEPQKHWAHDKTDWKAYWEEKNKGEKDASIKALEEYKQLNKEKLSQLEEEIKQNN